jgi:hypothetical protein
MFSTRNRVKVTNEIGLDSINLIPRVVAKASMSNEGGVRGDRIEVMVKGTSEVPPFQK